MTKTGTKLAAMLLAAMAVMFALVLGTQNAHAMSVYAPSIDLQRNSIILKVDNPYAGTKPGSIGSWEKVLDAATGTKITVMDMWIDAENGPMNEESRFVEGKRYTYQAYVASVTDSGTAPDLREWTLSVLKTRSDVAINWPDGAASCDKTASKILYTAQFTAKAVPSRDKGTYKLNLANGKVRVSDGAAVQSLMAMSYVYQCRTGSVFDNEVDLDKDGVYDMGFTFGGEHADCGRLSTTKIKDIFTVKLPRDLMGGLDPQDIDYYGAFAIQFDKLTNPLSIKAKTATVKYSKLKKKAQTLAVTKVITFTKKGQGAMAYTLVSAKKGSKSFKKYFKINKTTGKVTVKKNGKMKKGSYKVKVKVKAAGNANYKPSAMKTVTFKVKVK